MPAARLIKLARVLAAGLTGNSHYPMDVVGIRPGEKMHEVLVSEEEMWRATELEDHFCIPSWSDGMGYQPTMTWTTPSLPRLRCYSRRTLGEFALI
jgi:FlaA1/EpsC-like NDP-sugar epimerase